MKVVYFYHRDPGTYGAAKSMNRMIQLLKERYEVEPIIITPFYNLNNEFADLHNIENYVIPYQHDVEREHSGIIKKIYTKIKRYHSSLLFNYRIKKIDFSSVSIVHSSSVVINKGAYVSQMMNIPHVWHIRELERDWKFIRNDQRERMNQYTTKFIAISAAVAKEWLQFGIDKTKMVTIQNGLTNFPSVVKDHQKGSSKIRIVFAGYLSESKGQLEFLKSLTLLSSEIAKKISVDLIGDGDKKYTEEIKRFINIEIKGIEIKMLGYISNAHEMFSDYDIGVINSKAEAFGRTTVEYMLAELSVLASNTGANVELLTNGKTGTLFDYRDIKDLSQKIEFLVRNSEYRLSVAKKGRIYAENNYSDVKNAERIFLLYKKITEGV